MRPESKSLLELLDLDSIRRLHTGQPLTVLVGISGGADSVALLLALHSLADQLPLRLSAAHFNHGVRVEASRDEDFVQELTRRLGIACYTGRPRNTEKAPGTSPEEYWRNQRYIFFQETMHQTSSQFLALGHNVDDLAETFLYHLARGTGIAGLQFSFLKTAGDLSIIRPLWKTSRDRIETALTSLHQPWRYDSSNQDSRFSRNLIRHQVIPALRQINPKVSEAILRLSSQLTPPAKVTSSSGRRSFAVGDFRNLEDQGRCTAIHQAILEVTGVPPGHRQVRQACRLIERNDTGLVALGNRTTLVIDQQRLWVYPGQDPTSADLARHSTPPGLLLVALPQSVNVGRAITTLSGEQIIPTIPASVQHRAKALRNRHPGDRFQSRHLKKILIESRIPWYYRDFLVFAVDDEDRIVACVNGPDNLDLSLPPAR